MVQSLQASASNCMHDSSNQSHDELENTKKKLQESEAQVQELKTKVTILNDELVAQGTNISKLGFFARERHGLIKVLDEESSIFHDFEKSQKQCLKYRSDRGGFDDRNELKMSQNRREMREI
ncbi:hypothetical protein ACS0TY_013276 [Phlomoides rotata]